jgi:DNA processing protein
LIWKRNGWKIQVILHAEVHVLGFEDLNDEQKTELWAVLALQHVAGLGVNKRKKLTDFFGSSYKAVQAVEQWPAAGLEISSVSAEHFARGGWRGEANSCWKLIKNCPAGLLLYTDAQYPALLKEIHDAPLLLFYLGDPALLQNTSIAVVGTRKSSSEGAAVAVQIVRGLTQAGITSVSGLAGGIDRLAHLAGLEGIGSSIAVLGSGIDVPYPSGNLDLYRLMRSKGLILSEFMPGTAPFSRNFPIRNRIISGLSRAVLVVEAAARSGALITARHAAEQNRDVFAVPGPALASSFEGCRGLIRRGAKPVFAAEDILLELSPALKPEIKTKIKARRAETEGAGPDAPAGGNGNKRQPAGKAPGSPKKNKKPGRGALGASGPPDQTGIIKLLEQKESCHIEDLAMELNMPISRLSGILAVLEVKGLVKRLPGMFYRI